MKHWLIKSEPSSFSWQEQVKNRIEPWTGVRNYQARKNLQTMKKNDMAFFYHSNVGKEIVGIVRICKESYPDPTASNPRWICVDVETVCPLSHPVSLQQIKSCPELQEIGLIKQSRLSVMPIDPIHWKIICELGKVKIQPFSSQ